MNNSLTLRRRIGTGIGTVLGAAAVLASAFAVFLNVSPAFTVLRLRWLAPSAQIGAPTGIASAAAQICVRRNIAYDSRYPNARADIYTLSARTGRLPTLVWLHGGGFVSGDKSNIRDFAVLLAAQGYTVVSLNYALAPETRYPAPVVQLGEFCRELRADPAKYPEADPDRLAFGGDSAGAQIAAQFLSVQTNAALARRMELSASVPRAALRAAVFYCGPFDMAQYRSIADWNERLFVHQFSWAYFGAKNWQDTAAAQESSASEQATAAFPASFITDGNTGSFERDARRLQARLTALGVPVRALYFPSSAGRIPHEYPFNYLDFPTQAQTCFTQTLAFLNERMK